MLKRVLIVVVMAACGGGSKPAEAPQQPEPVSEAAPAPTPAAAPQTEIEQAMAEMRHFADAMCACKDPDCAKRVSDEMVKWSQEMAQKSTEPVKMTEQNQKDATALGTRMGECMQTAMSAGSGASTTP